MKRLTKTLRHGFAFPPFCSQPVEQKALKRQFPRTLRDALFVLLLLPHAGTCLAQVNSPASVESAKPISLPGFERSRENSPGEQILGDAVFIYPNSALYPAGIANQGAQGTVILLLDLTSDGHVKAARVHTGSGAKALDAAAIRKASTMTYQGRGTPPATVSLHVEFRRDSVDSLQSKSCADFNVDVAWFRHAFPGRPETEMPALQVTGNLVRLNYGSRDRHKRMPILDALPAALHATVGGCAESPERRFKDVFNHALKKASDAGEREPASVDTREASAACAPGISCKNTVARLPRSILHIKLDEPVWLDDQHVTPDMPAYPPELVATGIQGQVVLQISLTPLGDIANIEVTHNQSDNKALADAGVAYLRHASFQDLVKPDATPAVVIVPIHFDKDTEDSITAKTCADFSVDVAAWLSAHPKAGVRDMHVMQLARGVIMRLAYSRAIDINPPQTLTAEMANGTAAACASHPQALYFDVLQEQIRIAAAPK